VAISSSSRATGRHSFVRVLPSKTGRCSSTFTVLNSSTRRFGSLRPAVSPPTFLHVSAHHPVSYPGLSGHDCPWQHSHILDAFHRRSGGASAHSPSCGSYAVRFFSIAGPWTDATISGLTITANCRSDCCVRHPPHQHGQQPPAQQVVSEVEQAWRAGPRRKAAAVLNLGPHGQHSARTFQDNQARGGSRRAARARRRHHEPPRRCKKKALRCIRLPCRTTSPRAATRCRRLAPSSARRGGSLVQLRAAKPCRWRQPQSGNRSLAGSCGSGAARASYRKSYFRCHRGSLGTS